MKTKEKMKIIKKSNPTFVGAISIETVEKVELCE